MSASIVWFSASESNLCPSPVDGRQFSCQHLMVCLWLCQQSACTIVACHHSLNLCMLSRREHLIHCPSPGYCRSLLPPGFGPASTLAKLRRLIIRRKQPQQKKQEWLTLQMPLLLHANWMQPIRQVYLPMSLVGIFWVYNRRVSDILIELIPQY